MVSGDIQWIWSPSYERVLFELPVAKSCRVWINQTRVYYKTLSVYYKTLSDQWFIRRRSLDCIIFQKVDVGDGCWGPFVSVTSLRLSEIASTSLSPVIYDFKSNLIQKWTIFQQRCETGLFNSMTSFSRNRVFIKALPTSHIGSATHHWTKSPKRTFKRHRFWWKKDVENFKTSEK